MSRCVRDFREPGEEDGVPPSWHTDLRSDLINQNWLFDTLWILFSCQENNWTDKSGLCYDRTLLLFSRPIIDKDTSALIPHDCDPHLNQTKFNRLLPLAIAGVLVKGNKSFGMVWLILVLKLESSSMCCYLALVERLLTKRINCVRLIWFVGGF